MRSQATVVEKTIKYITVEAMSIEEANVAALDRAISLNSDTHGSTEVSSFRLSDNNIEVT